MRHHEARNFKYEDRYQPLRDAPTVIHLLTATRDFGFIVRISFCAFAIHSSTAVSGWPRARRAGRIDSCSIKKHSWESSDARRSPSVTVVSTLGIPLRTDRELNFKLTVELPGSQGCVYLLMTLGLPLWHASKPILTVLGTRGAGALDLISLNMSRLSRKGRSTYILLGDSRHSTLKGCRQWARQATARVEHNGHTSLASYTVPKFFTCHEKSWKVLFSYTS